MSVTNRLCSEWKTWGIVVSAMFSLQRPSPQAACALSSSLSYVPAACSKKLVWPVVSVSATGGTGGVAGLLSVSWGDGSALCAMSVRNGASKWTTFGGTGTGPVQPVLVAREHSTRPCTWVTGSDDAIWGRLRVALGRKLP